MPIRLIYLVCLLYTSEIPTGSFAKRLYSTYLSYLPKEKACLLYTSGDYWFETGTPTYLVELLKSSHYDLRRVVNVETDSDVLNSIDSCLLYTSMASGHDLV